MLTYDFNKRGNKPLYEFLYQCIKKDILCGKIEADEKLPSKREMAKNYNISIITVENAYAQLSLEGYIYSKEKRGYFVSKISNLKSQSLSHKKRQTKKNKNRWLVDFNSNHVMYDNFPFATWSKIMRKTLLDEENSFLTSPEHNGVEKLRIAIADHLQHFRGMDVNPDNIIVGAGTEYLYSIIVQILGKEKVIALEDPGYKKIGYVYESNGVNCVHIPIDKDGINIKKLKASKAEIVHISPSHHFPTGRVMPVFRRQQLIKWAEEKNSYIIEDDYDSEFRFFGRPIPAMAGSDSSHVIYMNTFSKTLAPSIRIAYMVLPDKLMDIFNKKLSFYSSTVSSFEQYTLASFIEEGYYERHLSRMKNFYKNNRNKIFMAIKESEIFGKVTIEEENAGLHFILGIKKNIDDEKFKKELKKNNINISAVSDYCYNDLKEFKHKFIINYSAVTEDKLKKALRIMNQSLENNKELVVKKYSGNKNIKINIPKDVSDIINKLEENGYEAFAVGGCVRDTILNKKPQDWDITTSAKPEQVKELFPRTLDTGIKHGTVTIMIKKEGYEVTTYRVDGEYNDSRHPDKVSFTNDLIEDLKRRDFTINAMAYNEREGLIDEFGGEQDINHGVIKCVGTPEERFSEDALRILRAIRFSAQLGFKIEEKTKDAIIKLAPSLENISAERIRAELEKLLVSDHPEMLIEAYKMGVTKVFFPEFDEMYLCMQKSPYHIYNVAEHTIKVVENVPKEKVIRWAALLHDVSKPEAMEIDEALDRTHFHGHAHIGSKKAASILRRFKLDNKTIKTVSRLVECHDDRPVQDKQTEFNVRKSVKKIGKDIYPLYLMLVYADLQGKSEYGKEKTIGQYNYLMDEYKKIMDNDICTSIKELKVTGKDLIELGFPVGTCIGDALEELLDIVINKPESNEKDKLIIYSKKILERISKE